MAEAMAAPSGSFLGSIQVINLLEPQPGVFPWRGLWL